MILSLPRFLTTLAFVACASTGLPVACAQAQAPGGAGQAADDTPCLFYEGSGNACLWVECPNCDNQCHGHPSQALVALYVDHVFEPTWCLYFAVMIRALNEQLPSKRKLLGANGQKLGPEAVYHLKQLVLNPTLHSFSLRSHSRQSINAAPRRQLAELTFQGQVIEDIVGIEALQTCPTEQEVSGAAPQMEVVAEFFQDELSGDSTELGLEAGTPGFVAVQLLEEVARNSSASVERFNAQCETGSVSSQSLADFYGVGPSVETMCRPVDGADAFLAQENEGVQIVCGTMTADGESVCSTGPSAACAAEEESILSLGSTLTELLGTMQSVHTACSAITTQDECVAHSMPEQEGVEAVLAPIVQERAPTSAAVSAGFGYLWLSLGAVSVATMMFL